MTREWRMRLGGALVLALCALPALAYVLNGYRWPGVKPRVPFYVSTNLMGNIPYFDPNYPGAGSYEDALLAIQNAASTWAVEGGSEFEFVYMGTTDLAVAADDGINVVYFDPAQCPYGNGCTAYIRYWTEGTDSRGFDVVFFGASSGGLPIAWTTRTSPLPWEHDLESKSLHEFGHALGLEHDGTGAVMSTSCGSGCARRALTQDDKDGVLALYGPETNDGFWADTTTPTPGTWVTLALDYGPADSGLPYEIKLSKSGSFPGSLLGNAYCSGDNDSRVLFVNPPFLPTTDPALFQGFTGTLDAQGTASATLFVPHGDCSTYSLAAFVKTDNPNPCSPSAPPSGIVEVSVPVTLTPQFTTTSYCTSKLNSLGCASSIDSSGTATLSGADDFHVTASNVLAQTNGVLLWGFAPNPSSVGGGMGVQQASPWANKLCVFAPQRSSRITSGGTAGQCDGSLDFHFTQSLFAGHGVASGTALYAQFFYSDPNHPDGSGLAHSDALTWWVCP